MIVNPMSRRTAFELGTFSRLSQANFPSSECAETRSATRGRALELSPVRPLSQSGPIGTRVAAIPRMPRAAPYLASALQLHTGCAACCIQLLFHPAILAAPAPAASGPEDWL